VPLTRRCPGDEPRAPDNTQTGEIGHPVACAICEYAHKHGWWGPGFRGTHCRKCHLSWTSRSQAHCPVCCQQFASNGVANYHWGTGKSGNAPAYDAKHLNPHGVPALAQDARGVWHMAEKDPRDHRRTHAGGSEIAEESVSAREALFEPGGAL
jgi:hypothetical protein